MFSCEFCEIFKNTCSRCLTLFACDSKAFTPWPESDTVFEQTRHLPQCVFLPIFSNQLLNSLFASQLSWKEVLYLKLLLIWKYKSQNVRRYYLKNINYCGQTWSWHKLLWLSPKIAIIYVRKTRICCSNHNNLFCISNKIMMSRKISIFGF